MDTPEAPAPKLTPDQVRAVTADFPRRHVWVRAFTIINGLSILGNALAWSWMGVAFSSVLFIASISAWRATTFFTAAHESGNKAAMFDAMEQLETYFKVSTVTLLVGLAGMVLLALLVVVLGVALGLVSRGAT